MRDTAWPTAALLATGLATGVLACSPSRSAPADAGFPGLGPEELRDPNTCTQCHLQHFTDWSHSVHAYASDDPVFVAMNKRGQRETNGALGDFCVKCHAPMAVVDGKTTDGLNLADLDRPYHGVTCFFCHAVDSVTGTHNGALELSGDLRMRGEYADPVPNAAHDSTHSVLFDRDQPASSQMCGACHDIVVRDTNAFIERTFCEWTHSAFNAPLLESGESCINCHMYEGQKGPIAQAKNAPDSRFPHAHDWPAVDVPANATDDVEKTNVQQFLANTFQGALCVTAAGGIRVILDPVRDGHDFPSGSAQDRRAWAEVVAYKAGNPIFKSGLVADGTPVVDTINTDSQLWLLRDQMLDSQGNDVRMFWQAMTTKGNTIPAISSFDKTDQNSGYYRTHAMQLYPRLGPGVPDFLQSPPDRVTLRLRLQPIGLDVLNDLVSSGDLDPSVAAGMPTYDVSFTLPDGTVTPSLEWLASASATYTPYHPDIDNTTATCVTTNNFDPTAPKVVAPEPRPPADCADGAAPAVSVGEDAGTDAADQCDPRYAKDTIAPGLTKQGDLGKFTFVLMKADPVPPIANYNSWVIKILDKNAQPVTDATFTQVKTFMPLHGHGSSVVPIVTNNGDGTYTINKLDLFMPGVWWVTPSVQSASGTDSVTFSFCVGG